MLPKPTMATDNTPLTPVQTSSLLLSALEEGREAAVLVALEHPDPAGVGARMVALDGEILGTLLDAAADRAGAELAGKGLRGEPGTETGTHHLPLAGGGRMRVFLELHHPQPEMIIVGAGHVAQPLSVMGSVLGLRVRVLDDRPEFATRERFPGAEEVQTVDFSDPFHRISLHPWSSVILVTRGHRYDYECLRRVLLASPLPGYIGMIGSRRRVRATFQALLEEGIPRSHLEHVSAPIGLDLGAETPGEIAVAVAAEIVQHQRGGSGRPLRQVENILDRFLEEDAP